MIAFHTDCFVFFFMANLAKISVTAILQNQFKNKNKEMQLLAKPLSIKDFQPWPETCFVVSISFY